MSSNTAAEVESDPSADSPVGAPEGRQTPEWVDRLLGSDPGLNRLRSASQAVLTIGVAMLAEFIFVHFTHALQIDTHGARLPSAQAAQIAAQHHGLLVIAIMLGAIIGMISAFTGPVFASTRKQVEGFLAMPPLMVAGLAVGLAVAPYRVISLAVLVAILAIGAYTRRFGPLGFVGGMVVFIGDFFGFFLHSTVRLSDLGWLTVEICIGVAVAIIAQFTIFYPGRRSALRRMQRSYDARARGVIGAAVDLLDHADNPIPASRRLHRRLIRLNETALIFDAQLSNPAAIAQPAMAAGLHQSLFDAELALTNMARFAATAPTLNLPTEITAQLRRALVAVGQGDHVGAELCGHELLALLRTFPDPLACDQLSLRARVVVHRFAMSVLGFVEADRGRRHAESGTAPVDDDADAFSSPVMLVGGWLPGTVTVSAAASQEVGPGSSGSSWRQLRAWDWVTLAPNVRVSIQMAVAVSGAVILGDLVSGRRFYWAVIAAFVTFMGANNTGEQVRKGVLRVLGTFVGVLVGATLAHMVGQRTDLAIAVILVALFFGLYFMRISYAFMVIGITIMVSQLYVQLDEFSNSLLILRLEETALGAAIAGLTVICVLPLRTGRVARVAARQYLQELATVVDQSVQRLLYPNRPSDLRASIRSMDNAYQSLVTTMASMRNPFPNGQDFTRERFLTAAAAARHYARNLLVDTAGSPLPVGAVERSPDDSNRPGAPQWPSPQTHGKLVRAHAQLAESLDELIQSLQSAPERGSQRSYVRAASLFDRVATALADSASGPESRSEHAPVDVTAPPQLALRDFELIDGALASAAEALGFSVQALDTTGPRAESLGQPA